MNFKELYEDELENQKRIREALSIPLGLLLILGSLLGVMLQGLWLEINWFAMLFWCSAGCSAILFVRTVYCLIRAHHGYIYKGMPLPLAQKQYRDELRGWHEQYGTGALAGDQEFEIFLEDAFAIAADHNAVVNQTKSAYLSKANAWLIPCALLTLFAFLIFAAHKVLAPTPAQKVEVINLPQGIDFRTMAQQQQTQPPPKPVAPPLRDLKEGQIPIPSRR